MCMMPGMVSQMKRRESRMVDEKSMDRVEAIILSMTKEERANPGLLNPSRKQRIAKGAGVDISEVNRIAKQFDQMKKMMKQLPGMMGGGKRGRLADWAAYARKAENAISKAAYNGDSQQSFLYLLIHYQYNFKEVKLTWQ